MGLTIYIIGFILAFFIFKWCFKVLNQERTWGIIVVSFIISFASWLAVIAILIATGIMYEPKSNSPKPPKWL